MSKSIGIDLGTTFSCVAIYKNNNEVSILVNEYGNKTTPSYISFKGNNITKGETAKKLSISNAKNTIFDSKRLIGRKFKDNEVQNDIKLWPFKIIEGENGKPLIVVNFKNEEKIYHAEQISSMILMKMKEIAEKNLGDEINKAVITVPAYFNDSQRLATKNAGELAGLQVLRIINEPTAAAIAYKFDKKIREKKKILVFDFGGGTFDISILQLDNNLIEVLASLGDTHLGGEDFDNYLLNYCIEKFKLEGNDISNNSKALKRLRNQCEKAKRILSVNEKVNIEIDSLANGADFNLQIFRKTFEDLCMDKFLKCIKIIDDCINSINLNKKDIDDIILVGGSSRILKIQELLQNYFDGKDLIKSINPDEIVAYGAAIHAYNLNDKNDEIELYQENNIDNVENINNNSNDNQDYPIQRYLLLDVNSLSWGTDVLGGLMSIIINRFSVLPIKNTETYFTTFDYQKNVRIGVYEGEKDMYLENNELDCFNLLIENPEVRGKSKIKVTFEIDEDGILVVTAINETDNNPIIVEVKNSIRLTKKDKERMFQENIDMINEENNKKNVDKAKYDLKKLINEYKPQIQKLNLQNKISRNNMDNFILIIEDLNKNIIKNALFTDIDQIRNRSFELTIEYENLTNGLNLNIHGISSGL